MLLDSPADASPARGTDVRDHHDAGQDLEDAPIADELLVEEVSIDGMCGVY
jgi:mycofactocin precursor